MPPGAPAAPPLSVGVKLVFFTRDGLERAQLEPGKPLVVGRGQEADLRIYEAQLSYTHARFTLHEDGVLVEDLGSRNGVWRAGQRVPSAKLVPGDEIYLATVIVRVFALGMTAEPNLVEEPTFRRQLEEELRRIRFSGRSLGVLAVSPGEKEAAEGPRGTWVTRLEQHLRDRIHRKYLYVPNIALILLPEIDAAEAQRVARSIAAGAPPAIGPRCVGMALHPGDASKADKLIEVARHNLSRARPGEPALGTREGSDGGEGPIFGEEMQEPLNLLRRVVEARASVLLLGETGTGKEVLAKRLHDSGSRSKKPFVPINCGAIQESLISSELFGHEKGAFTGADKDRLGAFREADGGTLFLDEIGELSSEAQKTLLRVLQDQAVTPVGSSRSHKVDVRIVAATHRDLAEMVDEGSFREDLYYRLTVIVVKVPPLRERADEIEPLAELFRRNANRENGRNVQGFSAEAMAQLRGHRWPGNVRELENVAVRAVILAEGDLIQPEDLPKAVRLVQPEPATPSVGGLKAETKQQKRQLETQRILVALHETNWNRRMAAKKLGLSYETLQRRMKEYGIKPPKPEES
ncbi:sigma 54-interacting transcriptional regulator [Polyangium sorediatum]|uniref:Sigma 54-interacting transcriptional regulator n=2 Tax=Polyangium sorediatum TaxID=889274 RepID=A0ABT6NPK9_9BACT|nr:sigma 54-interacting transcriptional regulator [Polyangium sorediatum]MDI1430213.1 sigma 54-interacting transcriptional regulator [Polyangium sorediatum]